VVELAEAASPVGAAEPVVEPSRGRGARGWRPGPIRERWVVRKDEVPEIKVETVEGGIKQEYVEEDWGGGAGIQRGGRHCCQPA